MIFDCRLFENGESLTLKIVALIMVVLFTKMRYGRTLSLLLCLRERRSFVDYRCVAGVAGNPFAPSASKEVRHTGTAQWMAARPRRHVQQGS